jgi:predicted nucleic acid-binding protein
VLHRRRVVLDTSVHIALGHGADSTHANAMRHDRQLTAERESLVRHAGILLEIGDGFASQNRRERGMQILRGIADDPSYSIVAIDDALLEDASALYCARADKEWGLTDCVTFCLMESLQLTEALTADAHFV